MYIYGRSFEDAHSDAPSHQKAELPMRVYFQRRLVCDLHVMHLIHNVLARKLTDFSIFLQTSWHGFVTSEFDSGDLSKQVPSKNYGMELKFVAPQHPTHSNLTLRATRINVSIIHIPSDLQAHLCNCWECKGRRSASFQRCAIADTRLVTLIQGSLVSVVPIRDLGNTCHLLHFSQSKNL
jgi:hypothetical protein